MGRRDEKGKRIALRKGISLEMVCALVIHMLTLSIAVSDRATQQKQAQSDRL